MLIGQKIRELRKARKLTLVELSEKSGVQLATLSRMENKKMVGTIESHMHIAKALGIDLTELYAELKNPKEKPEVETPKSLSDVFTHSDKSSYEILTKNIFNKKMMPILLRLEPGGKTNAEQNDFGAEKFIFVLEGSIEVTVGGEKFKLQKYNTFYFDASAPHAYTNTGKTSARALVVATPITL